MIRNLLILLLLLSCVPALRAQEPVPVNPAAQVAPAPETHSAPTSRRRPQQKSEPKPEPTPAGTAASTVAPATATPAIAVSPQPADDRLPFMNGSERDSHEQPVSGAGLLLRTLGALLLIVGLIVAAAWGMKRFGGARFGTPVENAPPLVVLNSLSLGERRSLTIVRFGERILLLGATPQSVTLLAETEADDFAPAARSVAEILNDERPAAFDQELISATAQLDTPPETGRGAHSVS